jgi:predicted porin
MNFKKFLLAIAMASCAMLAEAQSSVTVYGILDVGFVGNNYTGTGTSTTTKQTTSGFGQSSEAPSRLGFKGSEDLGGGTSAFFTIETGINPESSTVSAFNNRQTFVGIKQRGIGEFAIGTQYTPIYNSITLTDPDKQDIVVGSLLFPSTPQAYGNAGTAPYEATTSMAATQDAYNTRVSNSITYKSENMNGFTVNALYTQNNMNTTQTSASAGGPTNYNGYGLGVVYEHDKLLVTAAYQSLKSVVPGTFASPVPAIWSTAAGGTNTLDNETYLAGVYDFGILKAYAGWINRKVTDTINSGYYASRSAQQVGVRGFWTPTIESWASIGNGALSTWGNGSTNINAHFTGYQLGSNYWLSKRTNLYAIFGSTQTNTLDVSSNGYALGVKHTF